MTWIVALVLLVYAALKAGQFAFLGRAAGYSGEPLRMIDRLSKGEPWLLIIATLLTVPPALGGRWYRQHKFDAVLRRSAECFGLIDTYRGEPEIKGTVRDYAVYELLYGYRSTAFVASRQLGLTAPMTEQRLAATKSAFGNERARASAKLRRARLAETQECLHPPAEPANA